MSATALKKNPCNTSGTDVIIANYAEDIYNAMKNIGVGIKREILVMRGMMEWLLAFKLISSVPVKTRYNRNHSSLTYSNEVITVLANIIGG